MPNLLCANKHFLLFIFNVSTSKNFFGYAINIARFENEQDVGIFSLIPQITFDSSQNTNYEFKNLTNTVPQINSTLIDYTYEYLFHRKYYVSKIQFKMFMPKILFVLYLLIIIIRSIYLENLHNQKAYL